MKPDRPFLSVIVPACQAETILADTLRSLVASNLPRERWELIVVDDASIDDTAIVAAAYADTVLRLSGRPHGPAYARNRAFEVARGDILVFVDADVLVHTNALRRFAVLFAEDPELGAAFGSYDANPAAPGVVSQYRNLLHHYVHHHGAGEAETFWAGLGAVRKSVFTELDKFDEWHYERSQIEDIELGRRIRRAGYRILLDPSIQGTHLKSWTLGTVLMTDLRDRGIPWMRLLLREGAAARTNTLNVKKTEKACVALMGLSVVSGGLGLLWMDWRFLLVVTVLQAGIVALNHDFYRFLHRRHGGWFAFSAIPLHLLYYLTSGFSVVAGQLLNRFAGEPSPSALSMELSERGLKTWPPVPARPRMSIWNLRSGTEDRSE